MSHERHFLDLGEVPAAELRHVLEMACAMKNSLKAVKDGGRRHKRPLEGKTLGMIFDKPSTRTRVSFDVGMKQLGGETIILSTQDSQLGRGETIADTARVLSRYVDAIMIRTTSHERLTDLAKYASVPVINGLTDATHPCQIMADIMTFEEHKGSVKGRKLAWTGDGNNVLNSLMEGAARFGYAMGIATPVGREPAHHYADWARKNGAELHISTDPYADVDNADCVITDTWVSMGDKETANSHKLFQPFQVNNDLMKAAKPDAIFMHCLPAHRNEEVTDEVMDGPRSVVFDEAENRLHAQKGVIAWCFGLKQSDIF